MTNRKLAYIVKDQNPVLAVNGAASLGERLRRSGS